MKRWSLPLSGVAAQNTVAKAAQIMVENSSSLPIFHSFVTAKFFQSSSCLYFFVSLADIRTSVHTVRRSRIRTVVTADRLLGVIAVSLRSRGVSADTVLDLSTRGVTADSILT